MASEYYNDYGGRPAKRRRSIVIRVLDLILTIATVAAAVTMLLTYLVPYVDPARVWFFPVLGLAAPGIYVASVVLMLYWVIRWRTVRALVMLAIVVAGLFKVSLFWRPEIRRSYAEEAVYDRGSFRVMTYNVRSFYGENGGSSVDDILQLIAEQDPDIICLQEFNARLAERSAEFALLDEKYESAHFGRTQAPDSVYGSTMAILSKYRILRTGTVLTPSSSGVQQPPSFDGHQRLGQRVHHQPPVPLGHGARDQDPQHRHAPAREQRAAGPAGGQHRQGRGRDAHAEDRLRRLQRHADVVCLPHDGPGAARRFQRVRFGLFAYVPGILQHAAHRLRVERRFRTAFLRGASGRLFGPPSRRRAASEKFLTNYPENGMPRRRHSFRRF